MEMEQAEGNQELTLANMKGCVHSLICQEQSTATTTLCLLMKCSREVTQQTIPITQTEGQNRG